MDAFRLDGFSTIVTGGSKGIGKAIVETFLERGAKVLAVARNENGLNEMKQQVENKYHSNLFLFPCDVGKADEINRLVDHVKSTFPEGINALVNNVGINARVPTSELTVEKYEEVMNVNARSQWKLCVDLEEMLLKKTPDAAVVNISSVASNRAIGSSTLVYAMSKGAVDKLTLYLAQEWGPKKIRINTVSPWYIRTPLVAPVLENEEKKNSILERTPLGRIGEPEEVANAVSFLCSPASRWITGVDLPVDGGFTIAGNRPA